MSKFTPGPWFANVRKLDRFDEMTGEPKIVHLVSIHTAKDFNYINEIVTVNRPLGDKGSAVGNAQLIAVAPEMYDLLEEVIDEDSGLMVSPKIESLLKKIRGES